MSQARQEVTLFVFHIDGQASVFPAVLAGKDVSKGSVIENGFCFSDNSSLGRNPLDRLQG
ncbi:hypothetical protein DPMN_181871 [Dreissena polymorpha]|uniref:Uncharacterized protein n=1 Tax=Dreissena polymorpha TaxID=45954 RepID=A0A9D4I460_DREPO|nr:hypothetical protein DPMN_181871 [Dreissena polymorpha]